MIETLLLAMLVAKLKGYNLKPLFKSWTIYPILVCELVYILLQISIFMGEYRFIQYAGILKLLYLYLFLFPIIKYRKYYSSIIGSIFVVLGTVLNKIAIKYNDGYMPVFPKLSYWTGYVKPDTFKKVNDIHVLGNSDTKLKFLTDVIDIGYSILSIGDVFIRAFAFIIIYNVIKHLNTEKSREFKQITQIYDLL
ncbi:hypothetical protein CLHOM_13940 [Clostridium homopropionicum DSM 5847]|uniref:Uncharacterized protein n=1 Tax=Clostridium homopropionicum DSM 5847 TaxID=1121318 RepID=A0A0L6ZB64_9CLOT|nr:DUF5317 family protein [Clostridium homopropionicum]KOA20195.1 hypothetical protein CLHOM_13940 [Clostridium homopropionicum DSM 5847]SFG59607.1 hypothetical protein SAMN04488501_11181 [Clostridium homopropionicum]